MIEKLQARQPYRVSSTSLLILLVLLLLGGCQLPAPPAMPSQVSPSPTEAQPAGVPPIPTVPPELVSTDIAWKVAPVKGVSGELAVKLYTLSLISLDGGSPRSLEIHTLSFTWSPDGQKIAYIPWGDPWDDLWVVDVETGRSENLTRTPDRSELSPRWSPNGKSIAFYSRSTTSERYGLALVEEDGANYRVVDTRPIEGFSWAPDSGQIVYASEGLLNIFDLIHGQHQSLVLTDYGLSPDLFVCSPAWSPQGDAIAIFFSSQPAPEEKSAQKGYAILNLTDRTARIIKSYTMTETMAYKGIPSGEHIGGCGQPPALWSPLGEWLLLTLFPIPRTNLDGGFWLIDSQGKQERRLGGVYGRAYAADWSPDGKWVVYIALGDRLLWVVNPLNPDEEYQVLGDFCCEGVAWRPGVTSSGPSPR